MLISAFALAGCGPKPAPPETAPVADRDRIQGAWVPTAAPDTRLIFAGDRVTVETGGRVDSVSAFALDESKEPKELTRTLLERRFEGELGGVSDLTPEQKTYRGIYKLDGDTLMLAFGEYPADPWPTEFKARKGEFVNDRWSFGVSVITLRRAGR